ncbi:GTP 3',8-cyclase MoaA [uncultured Brevundimonas sp.]|uniref:GTP 3',8-cyclase MoaA n=1 Tax=uncultured Brevundimonas sp. TaxID=213418 RepID=UPI0030EC3508|tara:strand:- start:2834 stop:3826 length:993 start_codon:yes stop_codon:yes gene_type:complete
MAFDAAPAVDGFGRRFHYLRLSVTEVCNFSCTYCLPNGWKKDGPLSFLTVDEIRRLVAGFSDLGLSKVRLTGGEPSVRKDFNDIIATVANTPGVAKVAVTTNGWNLARHVADWRAAGLSHINISIDSLNPETFHQITGHDRLHQVLNGLDQAVAEGFSAVKVNAVLLRQTAEAGFDDWARFVRDRPVSVRFIELMKTTDNDDYFARHHVKAQGLRDWLDHNGWTPGARTFDAGPALEYRHPDHAGSIGLIAPYAPGFCDSCNRLRVTARGKLRLCLFGDGGVDLRELLQDDADREALTAGIVSALTGKAQGHQLARGLSGDLRNLAQLGG